MRTLNSVTWLFGTLLNISPVDFEILCVVSGELVESVVVAAQSETGLGGVEVRSEHPGVQLERLARALSPDVEHVGLETMAQQHAPLVRMEAHVFDDVRVRLH